MKKVFIIIAVVLVVAGLALLAAAFIGSGFNIGELGGSKYETKTYCPEGAFRNIDIRVDVANVELKAAEDGKVTVICEEREKLKYTVAVENGTLKISSEDKREWYEFISLWGKSTTLTLYLPESSYEALTVSSATGNVTVPGGFGFGSIDVETGTGNVRSGASASGDVKINSSTGNVILSSCSIGGTVTVKVSTGNLTLTDVTCASLESKGSTGNIVLTNVVASGSFNLQRSTGNVRFESSDAAEITVKTSTGSVKGSLKSGKTFVTKSSTGSVSVPSTTGGKCDVATSTGNIKISVEG